MQEMENAHLMEYICAEVDKEHKKLDESLFVCIDGFTATGKTFLAKHIRDGLARGNCNVEILCTDDFIRFPRKERTAAPQQYLDHKSWYDLEKLSAIANLLNAAAPVDLVLHGLYNHATGERDASKFFCVKEKMIIIIEGMYALQLKLRHTYKIVLLAAHTELQQRVTERDRLQRGVPASLSEKRYWINNGEVYQRSLDSVILDADLVIDSSNLAVPKIISCQSLNISYPMKDIVRNYLPHF